MLSEQLAFDDAVSYAQWWKSKLTEVMALGIELPTFRLGIRLWREKKVRRPNHSVTQDAVANKIMATLP